MSVSVVWGINSVLCERECPVQKFNSKNGLRLHSFNLIFKDPKWLFIGQNEYFLINNLSKALNPFNQISLYNLIIEGSHFKFLLFRCQDLDLVKF